MSDEQKYTIILLPESEGGFTVRVAELPEVVSCGETGVEAMAMAKEAIELAAEHRLSLGEPIHEGPAEVRALSIVVQNAA